MKTTRYQKSLTRTLALALGAGLLGALTHLSAAEVREEFHQTYPLEKSGQIGLENVNGNVRVITWDREEIRVEAIKHAKKQEHLERVKIEVDSKTDHIHIKTKYPDSKLHKNNSASVDYTLTVPKQSQLDRIKTVNGGIEIEGVSGKVAAESVNGPVTATGLAGQVQLSTVNGPVKAGFSELKQGVFLKSVNGGVTITLPPEVKANLSASTVNGGINSDFPVQVKGQFPIARHLSGKLGEGGPEIKMSSVNGAIRLIRGKSLVPEDR